MEGNISIEGAKNAALPIMAASLLAPGESHLGNLPPLTDVHNMGRLLSSLGAEVEEEGDDGRRLMVDAGCTLNTRAPKRLVRKMRASFLIAGPLLARRGEASIPYPGGCAIGSRPVDLHLKGFSQLGASVELRDESVHLQADDLTGRHMYLDYPSVTATENIMMAASLADGETILENAAAEPEVADLADYLRAMGADIENGASRVLRIRGVDRLTGCDYEAIPDRIEAGTFLMAGAITRGDLMVKGVQPDQLGAVLEKLKDAGVDLKVGEDSVAVKARKIPVSINLQTLPYPGFPTDLQPQMTALMTVADGKSLLRETVFDSRFTHVEGLRKMGAHIEVEENTAVVEGVDELRGAAVEAPDIRAGAALALAGLAARGITSLTGLSHLDRGYADFAEKLAAVGADIRRVAVTQSQAVVASSDVSS